MSDLGDFIRISGADSGLCVITTTHDDATMQASVVNAGVLDHPVSGAAVVGLVARGDSVKLRHLRTRPRVTLVAKVGMGVGRSGGNGRAVRPRRSVRGSRPRRSAAPARAVFTAAGGTHDDWDEYDRVMVADRRTVVFVDPERVYSNG